MSEYAYINQVFSYLKIAILSSVSNMLNTPLLLFCIGINIHVDRWYQLHSAVGLS